MAAVKYFGGQHASAWPLQIHIKGPTAMPIHFTQGSTVLAKIHRIFSQLLQRKLPAQLPAKLFENRSNRLIWNTQELQVLLFNEEQQQPVQIELEGRSGIFQSWLLGFDLTQNQILIDNLFPAPPIELLARLPSFKITLLRQQEVLQLWVRIREKINVQNKPAMVVEVLEKQYRQDRRLHLRHNFERRSGPLVKLQIPMQAQLRGTVVNMSKGGILLNIFGKPPLNPQDCKQAIRCTIQLNDQLQLDCYLKIKALNYFRSPCQHLQLRLKFVALSGEQEQILSMYLDSLNGQMENFLAFTRPMQSGKFPS